MQDISQLDLSKTYYNLSYRELFKQETKKGLKGLAKGAVTEFGAVTVDTGQFTGRSPKDKYIVGGGVSEEQVWWAKPEHKGSDNKPVSLETWDAVYDLAADYLFKQKLYVVDGWCGASEKNRVGVRIITPISWQAHFSKNMFIGLKQGSELFIPDWIVMAASEITIPNWQELGLNSGVAIIINLEKKMIVICGTWYGGEIKKGMFSVMNYELPLKGVGSFHCSANSGSKGDTALFFGLSGTGKTTLSADPKRKLIGDDEHGWDEEGIFNLEGGCYAKVINLSKEKEPDIYGAIKRDALLENVAVDKNGKIDFTSAAKTENTRMGYPLSHIKNIVKSGRGKHPKTVVFLTCDSFGVLPPVAKLTAEQARYWYLSGYTAKVAGTERGITEPAATFSSCFGGPFLTIHPTVYAKILGEKIKQYGSEVYLVNTGWVNGGYGTGKRMDITTTRVIIDRILDGSLKKAEYEELRLFGLMIPRAIKGVEAEILNPKNGWVDKEEYERTAERLARNFIDNFKIFTDTQEGKELEVAGPKV
ncbi:MAG: Atp Phosphoenolpyruvate carboxykinase [Candidatus Beckwithbacteria bacterium GW2011_GWA2_43_10]|uniref:Phosphoenolpyruvate carboxykinase (ATP) n=1 Tax=Candidatus Beckwithbacteria bacterium GW2011_GWA2_43_10 TaxID=1618369 RepID=A0A0G1C416_9BACT|nr:MAG: Atp Phosphoenolpyruvate carboxykinase [Candidatus Beckwithbacteria bacterium GW2011_GWA2_43_10]